MIQFDRFVLENGLKVIIHEDQSTPFVVVNITYNVGARDENEHRTGFAHLFEHLMFGGSDHAPSFDKPLELAGATNNAFTNTDITNYYDVIPKENLETALWLESDRMQFLTINEKSLEVQRKVVIEEFKERYLNQPYGETWHYLRDLAYKQHPYRWPTIGLTIDHIADATLEDVQNFYHQFYTPNNAILTLAGNITTEEAKPLVEKWFSSLKKGKEYHRTIPPEPKQTEARRMVKEINAPQNSIHIAFHMPAKGKEDYYECDLISDILGNGESARLNQALVKDQKLFSEVSAYILGSFENGLLVISGKPMPETSLEDAENAIWKEIDRLTSEPPSEIEFQKVKNKVESQLIFQLMEPMYKALNLSFSELLGDANEANKEGEYYQNVTLEQFSKSVKQRLVKENSNTLWQIIQPEQTTA